MYSIRYSTIWIYAIHVQYCPDLFNACTVLSGSIQSRDSIVWIYSMHVQHCQDLFNACTVLIGSIWYTFSIVRYYSIHVQYCPDLFNLRTVMSRSIQYMYMYSIVWIYSMHVQYSFFRWLNVKILNDVYLFILNKPSDHTKPIHFVDIVKDNEDCFT